MRSGLATFTQGQFYSKCWRYLSLIWFCKLKIYDYSHISQGPTIWYHFCIYAMLHNDKVLAYGDMNIRRYVNKTIVKKSENSCYTCSKCFPQNLLDHTPCHSYCNVYGHLTKLLHIYSNCSRKIFISSVQMPSKCVPWHLQIFGHL